VADDSNNDVNRALAACGASPMPYRNFEELDRVALDPSPTIPNAYEFPLLLEALPEIGQIPVAGATPEQPVAPVSEAPSQAPAASERMGLFAVPRRAPTRRFISDVSTDKPNSVPLRDIQSSRQTLSSVFRTLSAADPKRGERILPATGLQDIFSRL
jgi:hypothetical protein